MFSIEPFHSYTADHADVNQLGDLLVVGLPHRQFRQIVHWLTSEIRVLGDLEECLSAENDDAAAAVPDLAVFVLELSSFLKELQCPFEAFVSGAADRRFGTPAECALLLNYLLGELMVQKMQRHQRPKDADRMVIEVTESAAAAALRSILADLNLGQPAADVTAGQLFALIGRRVAETIPRADPKRMGPALFTPTQPLSDDQWATVAQFHRDLDAEYDLRRDMLITRLDVTVQSFQWSDKHPRAKRDAIGDLYAQRRRRLEAAESVRGGAMQTGVPALLAARVDLAVIERTVSARTRTVAGVQKHLMGGVPDRGGRTLEMAAPPPEMPSWTKRTEGGGGGGGRVSTEAGAKRQRKDGKTEATNEEEEEEVL